MSGLQEKVGYSGQALLGAFEKERKLRRDHCDELCAKDATYQALKAKHEDENGELHSSLESSCIEDFLKLDAFKNLCARMNSTLFNRCLKWPMIVLSSKLLIFSFQMNSKCTWI